MDIRVKNTGDSKKYKHVLNHVVSSTGTFGFMQPVVCRELTPQDTVTLQLGQKVYLNPLVKPTFGEITLKNYSYFVPITDIYHAYDSMMASQSYYGSSQAYIPETVPTVKPNFLYSYLMTFARLRIYTDSGLLFTEDGFRFDFNSANPRITQLAWTEDMKSAFWDMLGYHYNISTIQNYRSVGIPVFDGPTADTQVEYYDSIPDSYDFALCVDVPGKGHCLITGRFSVRARNLRKILIGAGFQLCCSENDKNVIPLFAIYKAYFDMFYPSRDKTWKDTFAHHFMEMVEQNNYASFTDWENNATYSYAFFDFLYFELSETFYTANPDFVSAHISGQSLPITSEKETFDTLNPSGTTSLTASASPGGTAHPNTTLNSSTTWPYIDILRRLYHRLNNTRVIGGRVKDLLRSLNASEARDEKESFFLGSSSVDCSIDFVTSTAETSDGWLAELAGRGIGSYDGSDDVIHYTAKSFGYFITLSAFVPTCGYAQAMDPCLNHLTKYDFFQKDFDSVTLVPSAKEDIFAIQEIVSDSAIDAYSNGFGNRPIYLEYKFAYNKCNGDMSLGSCRNSYLPFTLDKLLPFQAHVVGTSRSDSDGYENVDPDLIVNGTKWRYIGRSKFFGWFDRIFREAGTPPLNVDYDSDQTFQDDQFVFFNRVEMSVLGFALPTSDSFQTDSYGSEFKVDLA